MVTFTEAMHLVVLGDRLKYYESEGASFWWMFVVLCVLQGIKFLLLGMIRITVVDQKTMRETNAQFAYSIPLEEYVTSSTAQDFAKHNM